MRRFTPEEDQFLRENYLTVPATRLSRMLGRAKTVARQRMARLGLVVPREVADQFFKDSLLKKGNVSFNKGRKQTEYMTPEKIERTKATRFKKGNLPHNTKPDDCITIRPDKRGVKYKFIRIGLGNWLPLHRHVWQQAHGAIPRHMKLIFKDGNTLNCDLCNLELLTPAELMLRNTVHNYPKPIAQAIQLRGALNRKINRKLKSLDNEKQDK